MNSTTPTANPIDALIFSIAGSNAHNMVVSPVLVPCINVSDTSHLLYFACCPSQKGAALGLALQGILLGMVYSHSFKYFSIFNESDPRLYRALVTCGVVVNT